VCFVEKNFGSGGILTIAGAIGIKLKRPVSKISLIRDVMPMAIGGTPIGRGDKVVMVQDVLRTGTQTMQAVQKLEKFMVRVVAVISLIDCEIPENERDFGLRTIGIDLVSILRLSDIEERKKHLVDIKSRRGEKSHLPAVVA